mmetsp:Transcript_53080/g.153060  ORF Transcript_53080/g.153060 Transcript_53080/m.153060 type:complete len:386 (+) Transcript_53080:64-1221(+)
MVTLRAGVRTRRAAASVHMQVAVTSTGRAVKMRPASAAQGPSQARAAGVVTSVRERPRMKVVKVSLSVVRCAVRKYEAKLLRKGHAVVAGTDEAGRGPLAGPVVAAAFVVLDWKDKEVLELLSAVNDSKKLTEAKRDELFEQLTDSRFQGRVAWCIAEASVEEIDRYNILQASLAAMARAIHGLPARPDAVLVDGCNRPPQLLAPGECWTRGSKAKQQKRAAPAPEVEGDAGAEDAASSFVPVQGASEWRPSVVEAVLLGDGRVVSIGAASILAKVHRDLLMRKLHAQYPHYGFDEHKGYGTAKHLEALRKFGPSPEHRRSFAPVREALGRTTSQASSRKPPAKPPTAAARTAVGRSTIAKGRITKASAASVVATRSSRRRVAVA